MSQEELAYLLRLQGKQAMRGATLDLAPNDENLEKALLGAAERSLRSRGWIVVSGDTFSIEQTILGMVGFVLNAPYAIAVRRTPTGGSRTPSHTIVQCAAGQQTDARESRFRGPQRSPAAP